MKLWIDSLITCEEKNGDDERGVVRGDKGVSVAVRGRGVSKFLNSLEVTLTFFYDPFNLLFFIPNIFIFSIHFSITRFKIGYPQALLKGSLLVIWHEMVHLEEH